MRQRLRPWVPFCVAISALAAGFLAICGLAYLSYAPFDRDAANETARVRANPKVVSWLEHFAVPPARELAPHWHDLVDIHRPDHWTEDRWDDDPDPTEAPGTTYLLDGTFAHVAYDPQRHVVVSRFYDKYKTPDGTLVRTAPPPPMPLPTIDAMPMRSIRGLRVGDDAGTLARSGYAVSGNATLFHLPGPCRKGNPCAVLLFVEAEHGRLTMLYFFRRYYYGTDPGPPAPRDVSFEQRFETAYQRRTRNALSVFQRLGSPGASGNVTARASS